MNNRIIIIAIIIAVAIAALVIDIKLMIWIIQDAPGWVAAAYWWLMGSLMTIVYQMFKRIWIARKLFKAMDEELNRDSNDLSQYDDLYDEDMPEKENK